MSLVRFHVLFKSVSALAYGCITPGNFVGVSIWTAVEPCMGVVGACLPSLRPLIGLFLGIPFAMRSRKPTSSALSGSFFSKSRSDEDDLTPFSPFPDSDHESRVQYPWRSHDATVHGGIPKNARKDSGARVISQAPDYEELDAPPKSGIRVRTEIILSRSDRLDYNDRLF